MRNFSLQASPCSFLIYAKVLGKSYFPFSPVLLLSLFYLFPSASLSLPWPAPILLCFLPWHGSGFRRQLALGGKRHAGVLVRAAAAPRGRARGSGRGRARLGARVGGAEAAARAGAERAWASAGERARRQAQRGGSARRKRAREAWWRAGDRLVALGSAQVAQSAGRRWNRHSGAGSPSSRNCARLQAAAQMGASSNSAQVRARGWSYGAGRPHAAEGSAWESQLATAALRASFPVASSDDARALRDQVVVDAGHGGGGTDADRRAQGAGPAVKGGGAEPVAWRDAAQKNTRGAGNSAGASSAGGI
jgi:hypothetical protein